MSMRIYDFECRKHGKFESIVDSYSIDYVPCKVCGEKSRKLPSFRGTIGVFHDYYSPALDMHVTGAKQIRDKCKELGITALRPGDKIDYSKEKAKKRKGDSLKDCYLGNNQNVSRLRLNSLKSFFSSNFENS